MWPRRQPTRERPERKGQNEDRSQRLFEVALKEYESTGETKPIQPNKFKNNITRKPRGTPGRVTSPTDDTTESNALVQSGAQKSEDNRRDIQRTRHGNAPKNHDDTTSGQRHRYVPNKRLYPMGYKFLEELETKASNEVVFSIKSDGSGFKELLQLPILEDKKLVMCLHVISLACHSDHEESLSQFLEMLLRDCAIFLNHHLVQHLLETQNSVRNAYKTQSMFYILDFIETLQKVHPKGSLLTTQLLLPQVRETIIYLVGMGREVDLMERLEKATEAKERLKDRFAVVHGAKKSTDEVPNNFRDIPIFPDKHDLITNKRPFLRPNIVQGRYENADHYLDVQFRLLREDFVRPLREGIALYLEQIRTQKRQRLQDIKVYQDVKIMKIILTDNGVVHEITFDVQPLVNIRWESSKRLIYGALICLTMDNFESVYFGTVSARDVEKLKLGVIEVKFENQEEILNVQSQTFTMVETSAYFEASRHVLSALQTLEEHNFPLKEYIVELQKETDKPKYLNSESTYCLRSLASCITSATDTKVKENDSLFDQLMYPSVPQALSCKCTVEARRLPVKLFDDESWPSASEMSLDDSQFKAFQTSLRQNLCVIQGPPGTGKTHVGLKIMEALLHNSRAWNKADEKRNPILVVCYTNHALDQFLEGVLSLTTKVVRMGGRSTSEKLKPHNMNYLKRVFSRTMPADENYVGRHYRNAKYELEAILNEIKTKERILANSANNVLSEVELRNVILDQHYESFLKHSPKFLKLGTKDQGKIILYWLGIEIPAHVSSIPSENALIVEDHEEWNDESNQEEDYDSDLSEDEDVDVNFDDNLTEPSVANASERVIESLQNRVVAETRARVLASQANSDTVAQVVMDNEEYAEDINFIMNQRMEDDEFCVDDDDEFRVDDDDEFRVYVDQRENDDRVVLINHEESDEETENKPNSSEWKTQGGKKQTRKFVASQLKKSQILTEDELMLKTNIWSLVNWDRWRLYKTWLADFTDFLSGEIYQRKKDYEKKLGSFGEMRTEEEVIVAKSALVIGMTTTGASKYRHLVRNLRSKIVIVEEAAEVLEAHIVTSLSKHAQHLILIGDHQQLRPNPVVYDLAKRYNLEISLFERLINNGIPFVKLQIQHRMKPSISKLLVPYIYKDLQNHSSVSEYEEIRGFTRSVFFVCHQQLELKENESTSRVNLHEAHFLVSLAQYILQQGYKPSQITILTTYLGQLFAIQRLMHGPLNEVRATVVDNFQGEENDIILLSFVRSNEEGVIGFLQTENRVCVALSRAKKGLFCIGNFELLSQKSTLWTNITNQLAEDSSVGPALELQCQLHKNKTPVSSSFDFGNVPDGGCSEPCEFRLLCGHVCERKCHPFDQDHKEVKCKKPCEKTNCELKHKCEKRCYEECGACSVLTPKILPRCNHEIYMPCHVSVKTYMCSMACTKVLRCGHECHNDCGEDCESCKKIVTVVGECEHTIRIECQYSDDPYSVETSCYERCLINLQCGHPYRQLCGRKCDVFCTILVQITLPCGHGIQTQCHDSGNILALQNECRSPCRKLLKCEHTCSGDCGQCFQGRIHLPCQVQCGKVLVCGHVCKAPCSSSCPPCMELCQNRCQHSRCGQRCGYPCVPCQEKCRWSCKHISCPSLCGALCQRPPCNKACYRKLKCKHKCVGLCGEPCPTICRVCHKQDLQTIFFGHEDEPNARFIQLEDCHHVFEIRGLTRWFQHGNTEQGEIKMLLCPLCKSSIRKNLRFGNLVKEALVKVEQVKLVVFGRVDKNSTTQWRLKISVVEFLNESNDRYFLSPSEDLHLSIKDSAKKIKSELENTHILDQERLVLYQNLLNVLIGVQKSHNHLTKAEYAVSDKVLVGFFKRVSGYFEISVNSICETIGSTKRNANQVIEDLTSECTRLQQVANFMKDFGKTQVIGIPDAKNCFEKIVSTLLDLRPFTEKIQTDVQNMKDELMKLATGIVIGVSQEEKIDILKAMGLRQGHWYSCPNGHVYCITECGGAMVEGKCNECGAAIGGGSHTLRQDNRVASGMDGAARSAWSEQANMANYEIV